MREYILKTTGHQLEQRLAQLKEEYEAGLKKLAELDSQTSNLRTTMRRISGAIQMIEEELAKAGNQDQGVSQ